MLKKIDSSRYILLDIIENIFHKTNLYLNSYLPLSTLINFDKDNDVELLYDKINHYSIHNNPDETIIVYIRYAQKDFPNFPIQVMLKIRKDNFVEGYIGGIPVAAKQLTENRFIYDIKKDLAYGLKKQLHMAKNLNERYINGEENYVVIDIGSKDLITIGEYNKNIGWFTSIIKVIGNTSVTLHNKLVETKFDETIQICKAKLPGDVKIHKLQTLIKSDKQFQVLKNKLIGVLNKILQNHKYLLNIPWLIVDPIGIISKDIYNILMYNNNTGSMTDTQIVNYILKIFIRDILAYETIKFLKLKVKYLQVKEFGLSRYSYKLLYKQGIDNILTNKDTYILTDNEYKVINIADRQCFDLYKNGFNRKMAEVLSRRFSLEHIRLKYKQYII